jgi:hypothetical protein
VLDPSEKARFVHEHRDEGEVARVLRVQALDGDGP